MKSWEPFWTVRANAAWPALMACALALGWGRAWPEEPLVRSLRQIKPTVVALGTYNKRGNPVVGLYGSAFFVSADGHLVTAAHVMHTANAQAAGGQVHAFVQGKPAREALTVSVLTVDKRHDIAILKVPGSRFPVARLGDSDRVAEGRAIAICGYPYGWVFGLHAACQSGVVGNISPVALPASRSADLTVERIQALRQPFPIFQLDCTAYPGNSGAPLFLQTTGEVVGVVNSAFVRHRKEGNSLQRVHTAISYAIPINHAKAALKGLGVKTK